MANSSEGLKIGLIATYANWKGHDVFLKAAAAVSTPMARFFVIGGSIYQTSGSQFSRADLQRQHEVREREQDRRREEQQHDRAVHREQLVVLLG